MVGPLCDGECVESVDLVSDSVPLFDQQRRYDMNGTFQMQGGKSWILPNEMNAHRYWKSGQTTHFPLSNGGSVAIGSVFTRLLKLKSQSKDKPPFLAVPSATESSSLGRYVFGSEISYNKPPPRLPGLAC